MRLQILLNTLMLYYLAYVIFNSAAGALLVYGCGAYPPQIPDATTAFLAGFQFYLILAAFAGAGYLGALLLRRHRLRDVKPSRLYILSLLVALFSLIAGILYFPVNIILSRVFSAESVVLIYTPFLIEILMSFVAALLMIRIREPVLKSGRS